MFARDDRGDAPPSTLVVIAVVYALAAVAVVLCRDLIGGGPGPGRGWMLALAGVFAAIGVLSLAVFVVIKSSEVLSVRGRRRESMSRES